MTSGTNLHLASSQWASRPDDERFLSLEDLEASVKARTEVAEQKILQLRSLAVVEGNDETGKVYLRGQSGPIDFTHYSFGQLARQAGAPAGYLRKLSPTLVAKNLNYSLNALDQETQTENAKLLVQPANGSRGQVRAFTSETYGRIWDLDVVHAVQRVNTAGQWVVPTASYTTSDPLRATTLYSSDHNVFMFLVDPEHPIEAGDNGDDLLFRGFMTYNSEVGDTTFGLMTFLYRYVCDNRIIWGAQDISQLLIRHTKNGPYRFDSEAMPILKAYAETSTANTVKQIEAAKTKMLTSWDEKDDKALRDFLAEKKFTGPAIASTVEYIKNTDRGPNIWDVIQGLTSYAHQIAYTDSRIDVEQRASHLMDLIEA